MIAWHKCSRITQDYPLKASGYYEKVEDGKPTGIIVKDFTAYPDCETYDWAHIEKITSGNTEKVAVIENQIKSEEVEDMTNTLKTDSLEVTLSGDSVVITPSIETKIETVTQEVLYDIWKVDYEWTGDDETVYWAKSKKEAKGFKEFLEKKFTGHKVTIKAITKLSICQVEKIEID